MLALVDGDLLVYRCGFAAERRLYFVVYRDEAFEEDVSIPTENAKEAKALLAKVQVKHPDSKIEWEVLLEPESHALHNVNAMMADIADALPEAERMVVVLSGPTNFRTTVARQRTYKGNRDPDHKPTHGPAIKRHMAKHWETVVTDNEEADDYIGYTSLEEGFGGSVIVSIDKDLDMIPGLHYNFLAKEHYMIDEEQAIRFFWHQMVTGDPTDNIPGVPGMGTAKAHKALSKVPTEKLRDAVFALYVQGYGEIAADDVMEEMGQLLWIRRKKEEVWRLRQS